MIALADFLLARFAEDERRLDLPDYDVVLNSHGEVSARGDGWVTRGDCPVCGAYMFDGTEAVTEEAWWEHAETAHQRSRVLAECDAKRRIVVRARRYSEASGEHLENPQLLFAAQVLLPVLRDLAKPYVDHGDYSSEWDPEADTPPED